MLETADTFLNRGFEVIKVLSDPLRYGLKLFYVHPLVFCDVFVVLIIYYDFVFCLDSSYQRSHEAFSIFIFIDISI